MRPTRNIILEFTRRNKVDVPFEFEFVPQTYHLRGEDGEYSAARIDWDSALIDDISALRLPGCDPQVAVRVGDRLRSVLAHDWALHEKAIDAARRAGEEVRITIRSAAAEIYALPWELITPRVVGQAIGSMPGLLVSYEWPGAKPMPDQVATRRSGRVLLAWSAAGGEVPYKRHQKELQTAFKRRLGGFVAERDVISDATVQKIFSHLEKAKSSDEPIDTLHLLCHGIAEGKTCSLALNGSRPGESISVVNAPRIQHLLTPFAGMLRTLVIAACDSGDIGVVGNQLGSVAQMAHRAGIQTVIASRFPLSFEGSVSFTRAFYGAHAGERLDVEGAFLKARDALLQDTSHFEWASLQMYRSRNAISGTRPSTPDNKIRQPSVRARDVFISYAKTDKSAAQSICAALEARKVRCWIESRDLRGGAKYEQTIVSAIESSKTVIVILSTSANQSPRVDREIGIAGAKGVNIVPLRIDNVEPLGTLEYYLSSSIWVDAIGANVEDYIGELAQTVAGTDRPPDYIEELALKTRKYAALDPETALMYARKTTKAICLYLLAKQHRSAGDRLSLEELVSELARCGDVPDHISSSLGMIRIYASTDVRAQPDFVKSSGEYKVSRDFMANGLSVLNGVLDWFYVHYLKVSLPMSLQCDREPESSATEEKQPALPTWESALTFDTKPVQAHLVDGVLHVLSQSGELVSLRPGGEVVQGPPLRGRIADGLIDEFGVLWMSVYGNDVRCQEKGAWIRIPCPSPVLAMCKSKSGVVLGCLSGQLRLYSEQREVRGVLALDRAVVELRSVGDYLIIVDGTGSVQHTRWPGSNDHEITLLDSGDVGRVVGTFLTGSSHHIGLFSRHSVTVLDLNTGDIARKPTMIPGGIARANALSDERWIVLSNDGALWLIDGDEVRVNLRPDDEVVGFEVLSTGEVVAWTVEGGLHRIRGDGSALSVLRRDVALAVADPSRTGSFSAVLWDTTKRCRIQRRTFA